MNVLPLSLVLTAVFGAAACGTIVGGLVVGLAVAAYIGAGFRLHATNPPVAPPRG